MNLFKNTRFKTFDSWLWWMWNVKRQHFYNWLSKLSRKIKKQLHIHKWQLYKTETRETPEWSANLQAAAGVKHIWKYYKVYTYKCTKCGKIQTSVNEY